MKNQRFQHKITKHFLEIQQPYITQRIDAKYNKKHEDQILKQKSLPPINSPFLKKTLSNLFPTQSKRNLRYNDFEHPETQLQALNNRGPKVNHANSGNKKNPETHQDLFNVSKEKTDCNQRIFKSYSWVKHSDDLLKSKIGQLGNSLEAREKGNEKVPTESSQKSTQTMYLQLQKYNKMQRVSMNQERQAEKYKTIDSKQIRPANFVTQQKLNRDLYGGEKQQIRMIKSLLKGGRGQSLDKIVQIKNYTKFIPKEIFNGY